MGLRPLVIKLGGAAISSADTLKCFFEALSHYRQSAGRHLVIVHGGGCFVDDILAAHGKKSEKKQGIRVTPASDINLVVGALAGTANKLLQAQAISCGINTVGLSLSDGGVCKVTQLCPELGCVGKVAPENSALLDCVLAAGCLPIISSIGITAAGELMNINADQAAVAVAGVLDAQLLLLSDVCGVLDDNGVLLPSLDEEKAKMLIESGVINGGMIVKVEAAFEAAKALGRSIELASWQDPSTLFTRLDEGSNDDSNDSIGTRFTV